MNHTNTDSEAYQIMPEGAPYEPGFNMHTFWAALFVGFIMLPGAIYLGLVTGQSMAGASEWVTLILFIEILKRAFVRLKTQEIIILYWVAGGLISIGGKLGTSAALFGGPFGGPIWDQYFVQSPQAEGLARYIPDWLVPPPGSEALAGRTFLHVAWVKPILILIAAMILTRINALSLGYVLFRVVSDVERLPFPMAAVQAGGATALAETSGKQEGWRWRVFSIGAFIGLIWGLLYVVIPTLSGIFLTSTVQILPIPFVDFTVQVKSILPASIVGIGTDLSHILIGFVLPFWVVAGSFIASVLSNFFANPILYHYGILHTWKPGMDTIYTSLSNSFDFWLSFGIGTALIVAVVGISTSVRAIYTARRETANRPSSGVTGRREAAELPEGRGDLPIPVALTFWAGSTLLFVLLVHYLVPSFPWWITALFGFFYTPFGSYVGARMVGLTGSPYGASIPYLKEASFYLSGYTGAAVWFAPIPIFDHSGQVATFKQLELTKTTFGSIVRLTALTLVVMLICSFIFWSVIWKLGPIPSAAYPFAHKMWPLHATFEALWVKSTLRGGGSLIRGIIKWPYIVAGFGIGGLSFALLSLAGAPTLIVYGFITGFGTWPHYVIPQFIGAIIGRRTFRKRFGEARWRAYAPILLAGYSCGMGLIGMTSIAIALISKAVSQIVF